MFHKILVAVDNSPISEKVFNEAVSIAKATNANLMLLNVLSPFEESYLNSAGIYTNSYYPTFNANNIDYYMGAWEELKQQGLNYLKILSDEATKLDIPTEFTQNLGDPGKIICEVSINWNADLIIIGRRGHRGLNEFFLGSVSNYVLHHAPCSVLTVQGQIITKSGESQESKEIEKVETT
ncbi:universal stress protein [Brunnivagina elsteri]|uniref:Universal stress protein UspA n=1 Tax=Brunnivagina elsteri CCALA 953 TaxID=987040 RepID=A0A2A2TK26_9CYAN|nr:universal stress protein [Calothrix elsteri]PAX56134.1 universal stress protein UspA [Calothrix elsteri CCALA 953]